MCVIAGNVKMQSSSHESGYFSPIRIPGGYAVCKVPLLKLLADVNVIIWVIPLWFYCGSEVIP